MNRKEKADERRTPRLVRGGEVVHDTVQEQLDTLRTGDTGTGGGRVFPKGISEEAAVAAPLPETHNSHTRELGLGLGWGRACLVLVGGAEEHGRELEGERRAADRRDELLSGDVLALRSQQRPSFGQNGGLREYSSV